MYWRIIRWHCAWEFGFDLRCCSTQYMRMRVVGLLLLRFPSLGKKSRMVVILKDSADLPYKVKLTYLQNHDQEQGKKQWFRILIQVQRLHRFFITKQSSTRKTMVPFIPSNMYSFVGKWRWIKKNWHISTVLSLCVTLSRVMSECEWVISNTHDLCKRLFSPDCCFGDTWI